MIISYKDDILSINIPMNNLQYCIDYLTFNHDTNYKLTDKELFIENIMMELDRELDDREGNTLLSLMLDKAVLSAIENGAEGIDYGN